MALVETMVAIGLVGLFVGILMVMSSNVLGLLRSSKDNLSASHALQQRIEQLRGENWLQLTSGTHLARDPLALDVESTSGLSDVVETFTIAAYPERTGFTPVKVVRQNGRTTLASGNNDMRNELMVRVDVSVKWRGFPRHREHQRTTTALIARAGSSK
jgi:hypothetical protein